MLIPPDRSLVLSDYMQATKGHFLAFTLSPYTHPPCTGEAGRMIRRSATSGK